MTRVQKHIRRMQLDKELDKYFKVKEPKHVKKKNVGKWCRKKIEQLVHVDVVHTDDFLTEDDLSRIARWQQSLSHTARVRYDKRVVL